MTNPLQLDITRPFWFVGASFGSNDDQTGRFIRHGIWEQFVDPLSKYGDTVKSMQRGDLIAIKASFTRKHKLPFDYAGKSVSAMSIKATGVIRENLGDGRRLKVDWEPTTPRLEWYFYTNRSTVWEVRLGSGTLPWAAEALVGFTFHGQRQDYPRFLQEWVTGGQGLWHEFVERAREYVDTGKLEEEELNYKLDIAGKLVEARRKLFDGTGDWGKGVIDALNAHGGNLMNWRGAANVKKWCAGHPDEAKDALHELWADAGVSDPSVSQRIRAFSDLFPKDVQSGSGSRMRSISVLLMGLDAIKYPPFMYTVFDRAYKSVEYETPAAEADEAAQYEHALGFLDRFIMEARNRDLEVADRLVAQSLVWAVINGREEDTISEVEDPESLQALASRLFLPIEFLLEIETLLLDKKQVIFQGPPGTGKTFVARALARHLAESSERVTLVQFHPSYAYEDFVQGFRPKRDGEGFDLQDGPLLRAAKAAENDPDNDHFLIIDEINRGNLGKVFGELYFLLEYRDEAIQLQYHSEGDEPFRMPENLYIIGTMNTADRSIALVDLALRRRFSFMDFHPDDEPVKDVLRKWLQRNAPDMEWVATLVEEANEKLKDDRHAAIGPSYFIKPGLDDAAVKRIWKHNILPYLQERLYERESALDDFQLSTFEAYRSRPGGVSPGSEDGTEQDGGDDAADGNGQSAE